MTDATATLAPASHNETARWQAADARHHLHPFTDHSALAGKGVRVITRAEGVRLWDSEGKSLIDGMGGLWCVQVGYGRRELADAGAAALRTLPYYNSFFQTTTPATTDLAERLSKLTPAGLDLFMFANSGSEANDTGAKLVRYFWNLQGKPTKKTIISRELGYHGVTMAAASMSGMTPMHPQFDLPLPGFEHVACPYWFGSDRSMTPEAHGAWAAAELERKILELGPDNVAAFIAEPVQGAGGLIIPPPGYWAEIQRICRKHDVLLWSDEVICGFGRTGEWFGCQTFGFTPDLMTMAKGLSSGYQPISALALGTRMAAAISASNEDVVTGFTYSGHPVACAVSLANLDVIEAEGLVARVRDDIGPYFQRALASLDDHPLVGETRSVGLLGAIEIVADKATAARFDGDGRVGTMCREFCFANGLIMRAVRDTMVLSPPLVITHAEVDEMIALARRCLDKTATALGR